MISTSAITLSIWPLSVSSARLEVLHNLLSHEEQSRAQRFRSFELMRNYVVSHGVARELLSLECEFSPGAIEFIRSRRGKPEIRSSAASPSFSLAHGGQIAALATCHTAPLGVDLEPVEPISEDLICAALSASEGAALNNVPATQQATAFFRAWTLKEAYLKGTGEGLLGGLENLELEIKPNAKVLPVAVRGSTARILDWQFLCFEPAPGYVGAIAIHARRQPTQLLTRKIDPEVAANDAARVERPHSIEFKRDINYD